MYKRIYSVLFIYHLLPPPTPPPPLSLHFTISESFVVTECNVVKNSLIYFVPLIKEIRLHVKLVETLVHPSVVIPSPITK